MKARLPKGMGGGPQNMQSMIKQAQKMQADMEALQEENVEVLQTVDSHTTISALIKTEDLAKAVTVLHKKFRLSL